MTKIAFVITSLDSLGPDGPPSGFWFEELATPYYEFKDAGCDLVIASPAGGSAPPDPWSLKDEFRTDNVKKFQADKEAMALLTNSVKVSDLDPDAIDAIFFVGGFATTYDFPKSKPCIEIVEKMAAAGKITAAICGGVCSLCEPKVDGKALLEGKECVSLRNAEVEAVGMAGKLAFEPETRIKELNGIFKEKDPFGSNAVVDGNIITGQNFASSKETAQLVLKALAA